MQGTIRQELVNILFIFGQVGEQDCGSAWMCCNKFPIEVWLTLCFCLCLCLWRVGLAAAGWSSDAGDTRTGSVAITHCSCSTPNAQHHSCHTPKHKLRRTHTNTNWDHKPKHTDTNLETQTQTKTLKLKNGLDILVQFHLHFQKSRGKSSVNFLTTSSLLKS